MGFLGSVGEGLVRASTGGVYGSSDVGSLFGGGSTGTSALDFIPGIGDARAQAEANQINIDQANINRKFQERMSNTAYQRAMADMKKAGLNPTLAYIQGGASAPSGAQASVDPVNKTGLADFALKATTGIGGLNQTAKGLQQQQAVNESTVQLNATQAAKNVADAQRIRQETKGLGRKAEEGNLWSRFYKGINNILDSSAKDAANRGKTDGPLIKNHGKVPDKEGAAWFKWLTKPGQH